MRILGTVLAVAVIFAGCGSGDDETSSGKGGSGGSGGSTGGSGGSTGGSGGSTGGSGGSTGGSGGSAGTATGGSAGTATGGTAGTASGGAAGTSGAAGAGGKPNPDGGTGGKPGDAGTGCNSNTQCKTFSSYCSTAPCQCIPLGINDKNPACTGQMITCLVDPCLNKSAACVNGVCVITP